MKKYYLLSVLISLVSLQLYSFVIRVDVNGTGDALTIQSGVNLAVDGDTVLVYEGIYSGDVRIEQKTITLGSLYIIDGDTLHIYNTIIDGEDTYCGIRVNNCPAGIDSTSIIGFTIKNGKSDWDEFTPLTFGGGIAVANSHAIISDCIIYNCRAYDGGGIGTRSSFVKLLNNKIFNNVALSSGGGVASAWGFDNQIIFDANRRNSIYLNHAGSSCDISISMMGPPAMIFLQTGTVANPDSYFYGPEENVQVDIIQGAVQQVSQDLWVSPSGNNENSGLNLFSPLQTVYYALAKANPDSLHPITIHLLSGRYAWSDTKQAFPIHTKSYLTILGESRETVIFDAEGYGSFFMSLGNSDFTTLQDITCINGFSMYWPSIILSGNQYNPFLNKVSLINLTIKDTWIKGNIINLGEYREMIISGIIMKNLQCFNGMQIQSFEDLQISNSTIQNIRPNYYDWTQTYCCGIAILVREDYPQHVATKITNCLITDNLNECTYYSDTVTGLGIGIANSNASVVISNCTIANNSSTNPNGAGFAIGGNNYNAYIFNSIISGNSPYNVSTNAALTADSSSVFFDYCLVEDGDESIVHISGLGETIWLDGNIFTSPLFDLDNQLPYHLSSTSPAINAGTPDPTGLDLPLTDLAGNLRVWDGRIDMGCYEYGAPPVGNDDPELPIPANGIQLSLYPNPVYANSSKGSYSFIEFTLPKKAKEPPVVEVFNLKGQKVRSLSLSQSFNDMVRKAGLSKDVNTGGEFYSTVFDCKDMCSRPLASGIYLVRVKADGKQTSVKMTIIR